MKKMPRFYIEYFLNLNTEFQLPPAIFRHVQVLRLKVNDELILFHAGHEYRCQIQTINQKLASVLVQQITAIDRNPERKVHLVCVMPANERMDWLVEKATELGVSSIHPLMSERSVVRLNGERADKKKEHWRAISIAACEQCGGNQLPLIHPVSSLKDWLASQSPAPNDKRFLLSLRPNCPSLASQITPHASVYLLTGPEGGFTEQEEDDSIAQGYEVSHLGKRILRVETAALMAAGLAMQI